MSKSNIAKVSMQLYELLEPLESEDRLKSIEATLVLLGEKKGLPQSRNGAEGGGEAEGQEQPARAGGGAAGVGTAAQFFTSKDPRTKGEELAVAARYRELTGIGDAHDKAELKGVITQARRNFDEGNFYRDITNATRQSGFFSKGHGEKGKHTLAYYGQQYVDALPDREKAKAIRRPKAVVRKGQKKKPVK